MPKRSLREDCLSETRVLISANWKPSPRSEIDESRDTSGWSNLFDLDRLFDNVGARRAHAATQFPVPLRPRTAPSEIRLEAALPLAIICKKFLGMIKNGFHVFSLSESALHDMSVVGFGIMETDRLNAHKLRSAWSIVSRRLLWPTQELSIWIDTLS
jgi:hypothetical protein